MRVARVMAQAKVNLVLRVGPRDESGYHQITTLFQRLELADEVVVRVGGSIRALDVREARPSTGLGPAEKNLAFRAATAYAERSGWLRGFSIELTKNIPVGGGLGGGSADAGAVLRALDALAPSPLGATQLEGLAAALGSDVPFLTGDHVLALGSGRGEQLVALTPLPERDVVLAVPAFGISTADAYRWLDEAGGGSMTRLRSEAVSWEGVRSQSHNDFEFVVEERYPALRQLRERLAATGASIARLSGSGSTVFGVFDSAPRDLAVDALVIATRTSSRVVQVEVLE